MAKLLSAFDSGKVSKNLGVNVATLRKARGLSQQGLSDLAKVPRSTITYIESEQGNPSLHNLIRIAGALQVSIEELLSPPRSSCLLVRSHEVPSEKRGHGLATLYKLLPDPVPGMEFDRIEIEKGGRMGGVPHTPQTKEYLVCIQGSVQVAVMGERYQLEEGDVLAFPGDQHHSYMNLGSSKVVCLSAVVLAPVGV